MRRVKFNKKLFKFLMWLCVTLRLDQIPAEADKPPKMPKMIPKGSAKARLDASVVMEDSINSIHFTRRDRIAGSSGTVHIAFNVNISHLVATTRRGCEMPQLLQDKIEQILQRESDADPSPGNSSQQQRDNDIQRKKLYRHYHRIHISMERRCLFELRTLLDYMEVKPQHFVTKSILSFILSLLILYYLL